MIVKPAHIAAAGETFAEVPSLGSAPVPVQGRDDVQRIWGNHVIVLLEVPSGTSTKKYLYDPSYGTGPFYEHAAPYNGSDGALLHYNNNLGGFQDGNLPGRVWPPSSGSHLDIKEIPVP
jgi:hypothetical protein